MTCYSEIDRPLPPAAPCAPSALRTLGLALALMLTACGGVDSSTPPAVLAGGTSGSTPTPTPVPAPTPSPSTDTTKPTVSITSPKANATVSGATATLGATAADNVGVAGVQFRLNGANTGSEDTTAPYSINFDTTKVANGAYTLSAVARDAAGNTATAAAITVTVTNTVPAPADTSAPSTPNGLGATAPSSFQVNLAWNAATDNVGVAGYRIYRNGTQIGTTTQRTYAVTGLSAQTSYSFQVAAYDAASNVSAKSVAASATTLAATAGTTLADLASKLKPGEWGLLPSSGFNNGSVLITPEDGSILEYTNELLWDPARRAAYIVGTARGSSGTYGIKNTKWVQYSEATNSWTERPNLPFFHGGHMYDKAALDRTNGDLYIAMENEPSVWRYDAQTSSWGQVRSIPWSGFYVFYGAMDYMPDLGGVVYLNSNSSAGNSVMNLYQRSSDQWTTIDASSVVMGDYHQITEYDGVHHVLYFGGGEIYQQGQRRDFFKLDANRKITRLADAPVAFGVQTAETVVDPVTGNFLLFPLGSSVFYEYRYDANQWVSRSIASSFRTDDNYGGQRTVGTAIPEHGVVMFVHGQDGIWLYKNASP